MTNQKATWYGASKKPYEFTVFEISTVFDPNQNGNYIFAKKNSTGWDAVYIGQGDIKTRTEEHLSDGCVTRKNATHIHAHLNLNEKSRTDEESDLLGYNTEAYIPTGCNKKIGG